MVTLARMGPDDAERVRAIRLRALRDAPDAFWVTVDEEERKPPTAWRDRLTGDSVTYVADDGDGDVGLVVGSPHHERAGDAGLYALWVAPSARRAGVARALVAAVVDWAREAGYATLRLDVGDANAPAIRLYERLGFRPTGAVERFPAPRDHITEHERALDLRGGAR